MTKLSPRCHSGPCAFLLQGRAAIWTLLLLILFGLPALAQQPVITMRFANPQFDCVTDEYCVDVELQSNVPNQQVFGINVRFFYDDAVLELINFRDFQGGYGPFAPNPPVRNTADPGSGAALFNFPGANRAEFINGAIQLIDPQAPPVVLSTNGWTKLFQMCFNVDDPNADVNNFCPSLIWDLEANPQDGGFLPGADGVVITVVDPNPMFDSAPAQEAVAQFNWAYSGQGAMPFGMPTQDVCTSILCVINGCPAPTNLTTTNIGQNSATLNWTSNDTPTDNCWVVTVGGAGLADCSDAGQALIQTTVCYINNVVSFSAPVTAMTVNGNQISVTVGGLQPGTTHNWYVSETCDGAAPPLNVSVCAGPGVFTTLDAQYTVTATAVRPTCPFVSPGYVANGSFTVTVTNGTTCAGTYTVNATPVAGSGPAGSTPPLTTVTTYIGFPAGAFFFGNAGVGQYTVTVTETGTCNPLTDPVVITVTVLDGIDTAQPFFYVTDVLGNILVDNDPATAAGTSLNLGIIAVPEGECGRQDEYYVYGTDSCDGFINAANAVTATATTTPGTIVPGTQVSVTPDGFGFYLVDVHWSTGTSTVSIFGRDASGNIANAPTGLTLTATIPDNVDPVVTILGSSQFTIPTCATSVTGFLSVQIDDLCDQSVNFANLTVNFGGATGVINFTGNNYREYLVTFPAAGNYIVSASYTDASGNLGFFDMVITVVNAAADQAPTIEPNAETVTLTACANSADIIYSFIIIDDCAPIDITQVQFNGGGSGLPNLNGAGFFYTETVGPNTVYFEVAGTVTPGVYFPLITYQGTTANPTITVLQEANQPADIIMPGNLVFTVPVCQASVPGCMSITILDDCDNPINPASATFTLGGTTIVPTLVNAAAGYFEFCLDFGPAQDGDLLVVTYTDGQGAVSTADALITVNSQPDNWAPIIVYPAQDINLELDPCDAPTGIVFFEVTATDNCSGDVTPVITVTPTTGTQFTLLPSVGGDTYVLAAAPGSYQVLITATDAAGNVRQEDFFVNISQDAAPAFNVACVSNLNVTLNADCQAVLTSEMVLSGNFGCVDPAQLTVTVMDSNPSNGPVVDGCGVFDYSVTAMGLNLTGFTGAFAPNNWTAGVTGAGATLSFTDQLLRMTSGAAPGFNAAQSDAFASIAMPSAGLLSFDYYIEQENSIIDDIILIDLDGNVIVQVGPTGGGNPFIAQGTISETVQAGWVLLIQLDGDGFATGGVTSVVEITNFAFASGPDTGSFTTCWGTVTVEDKTAPAITCPDDTNVALTTFDVSLVTGSLDAGDRQLDWSIYPCFLELLTSSSGTSGNNLPGLRRYDTFTFQVTQEDIYTFDFEGPNFIGANGGALAVLYAGDFDEAEPCSNVIAQNDQQYGATTGLFLLQPGAGFVQINFNPTMRVALPLVPGQTYTLLTTSTLPAAAGGGFPAGASGSYTWAIYGDQGGSLVGVPTTPATELRPLICDDIDNVRLLGNVPPIDENGNLTTTLPTWCYRTDKEGNVILPTNPTRRARMQQLLRQLDYTGYPHNGDAFGGAVSDNCGNIKVCVTETVNETITCTPSTITRTFTAYDRLDSACTPPVLSASCTQVITVRKPNITDVTFPPFTNYLECDEVFTVDANGNPSPAHTGYPFVRTAFGVVDINETVCNLGATYSDQPRINVCAGSYKVFRTWTVLDWCAVPQSRIFNQVVKVGDFSGPVITAPFCDYNNDGIADDCTFSSNAFGCNAFFQLPFPDDVFDNCSSDVTVSVEVVAGPSGVGAVVAVGAPGTLVGPIPQGDHRLRYTATDACGNTTVLDVPFRVLDQVAPTAVCDDDLHISITGAIVNNPQQNIQGVARVFADQVDEGSADNCSEVRLEVRRRVLAGPAYGCLPAFDYDGDGLVINDEVRLSGQAGLPDGVPGQSFYFTPWLDFVDVTCCDVNGTIRIELRVWADANGNGIFGRWFGNPDLNDDDLPDVDLQDDPTFSANVCWLDVLVEDKLNPICYAPGPRVLACDGLPTGFPSDLAAAWAADQDATRALLNSLFGEATGADNCLLDQINEQSPLDQRDDCGFGTIIRRFQVVDFQGLVSQNNCRQTITITEVHNYEIKFPRDAEADCGDPNIPTIETHIIGCDLLAISGANGENDERFDADGDECYKLRRTYRVINWCQWDGESDPVVIRRDEDCDNIGGDEDIWVLVRPNNVVYLDRDNNENNNNPLIGTSRCAPASNGLPRPNGHWANSTINQELSPVVSGNPTFRALGYYEYSQFIKVYDTSDPVIDATGDVFCSYDNVTCDGPVSIPATVTDDCGLQGLEVRLFLDAFTFDANGDGVISVAEFVQDADLTNTASLVAGGDGNYTLVGTFPIGRHAFLLEANDGCYNVAARVIEFEVEDCKVSAPVCINGLTATLMPVDMDGDGQPDAGEGMSPALWAREFVASLDNDCTGPLKLAIYKELLPDGVAPNPNDTGIVFTCDDDPTQLVYVYAIDGAGNYDFCETYVLVQDPNGLCGAGGSIAGVIETEEVEPVQGVELTLSGQQAQTTGLDGAYGFMNLPVGDYTVTPHLNTNHQGITTLDIVIITRHILNIAPLGSPYKMIAADVNRSSTITTLDLIQMRRIILGIDTQFASNTFWRFFSSSYTFPVPGNPWFEDITQHEVRNYNNLAGAINNADFVAVATGDVNSSAQTSLLGSEERTLNGTFSFEVAEASLTAGDVYTVDFRADEMATISGYQATLQLTGAELVDIVYGVATEEHFGLRFVDEGMITTSWDGKATAGEVLFSLVIRATTDAQLSEVLGVSSRYTVAEAYDVADQAMHVAIRYSSGVVAAAGFEVYQNVPNPFKGETQIGFNLPADSDVQVTISDLRGRILAVLHVDGAAGYNQLRVTDQMIQGATGVLNYTVTAGEYTATRKMVVVE